MVNDINKVIKNLSEREKLTGITMIVLGIVQCLSCMFLVAGIWNIVYGVKLLKHGDAVLTPYPGIVQHYDESLSSIKITIILNVIFGGLLGVACAVFELIKIRDYALDNRQVFDQLGL